MDSQKPPGTSRVLCASAVKHGPGGAGPYRRFNPSRPRPCGGALRRPALDATKKSVNLSVMTTITTREIQRDTRAVRQRLLAGETLQWKLGPRVVGHLVPAPEVRPPLPWPDLAARLRHLYQRPAGSAQPAARQIYADRG